MQFTFHETNPLFHVIPPSNEPRAFMAAARAFVDRRFGITCVYLAFECAVLSALKNHPTFDGYDTPLDGGREY